MAGSPLKTLIGWLSFVAPRRALPRSAMFGSTLRRSFMRLRQLRNQRAGECFKLTSRLKSFPLVLNGLASNVPSHPLRTSVERSYFPKMRMPGPSLQCVFIGLFVAAIGVWADRPAEAVGFLIFALFWAALYMGEGR